MSERFIKFIDSEEADWLRENQPNAFLLLSLIASRARRVSGKPDGLEIGECHIGDYKKAGIETRGQYRHALSVLIARAHIKITETCRTRKKATTGTTTEGTKVKLLDSGVWDINPEVNNHRNNHSTTTEQPPNNHEQECKEYKERKEEERVDADASTKLIPFSSSSSEIIEERKHNIYYQDDNLIDNKQTIKYSKKSKQKITNPDNERLVSIANGKIEVLERVYLTLEETDKLVTQYTLVTYNLLIEILSNYKCSTGKIYLSDYHTVKGWVFKSYQENKIKSLSRPQEKDRTQRNENGVARKYEFEKVNV